MADLARLTFKDDERTPIASLEGEIDLSNARPLMTELIDHVANSADGMIVDLSSVSYLDSAGLHMLFELAKLLRRRRQVLTVVIPEGSNLDRVVQLVEMSAAIPVTRTIAEGVAAIDDLEGK